MWDLVLHFQAILLYIQIFNKTYKKNKKFQNMENTHHCETNTFITRNQKKIILGHI